MSALILLALALASYMAFAALRDARSKLVRQVAQGMTKAASQHLADRREHHCRPKARVSIFA